jgi:hypothetical protein
VRGEKASVPLEQIPPVVRDAVIAAADAGRLSCARAHELAAELGVSLSLIGQVADALGLKLVACQLGCF